MKRKNLNEGITKINFLLSLPFSVMLSSVKCILNSLRLLQKPTVKCTPSSKVGRLQMKPFSSV